MLSLETDFSATESENMIEGATQKKGDHKMIRRAPRTTESVHVCRVEIKTDGVPT